jgi:potassium inwardly-rectifying channel subfamily J
MKFKVQRSEVNHSTATTANNKSNKNDEVIDVVDDEEEDEEEDDEEQVQEDEQEASPSGTAVPDNVVSPISKPRPRVQHLQIPTSPSSPVFPSSRGSWSTSLRQAADSASPTSNQHQHTHSQSTIGSFVQTLTRMVAERGRTFARRQTRRLVFKDGTCNVASKNVTQRRRRYLVDIFTTMVDMKWRYHIIMFSLAFVVSWLAFALTYWVIGYVNGDMDSLDEDAELRRGWVCASQVYDFRTALLFSIETQHTIGYGYRVMEPNCVAGIIALMCQSCIGVFIQCLITGIVFSKLSRPKSRAQTIMFSRQAVICLRDRQYCLLFRVGDMRRSHIVGTSIRVVMIKNRLTREGESIPLCQLPMSVETDGSSTDSFLFLVWPVTVVHRINESSPLWDMSADQLLKERFEIIVILEGTVESNGKLTQVRTSYLPGEILWGHRLTPLMTYEKSNGQYDIDYSQFHATTAVSMPDLSARSFAAGRDVYSGAFADDYAINFTAPAVGRKLTSMDGFGSTPRQLYRRLRHGLRGGHHRAAAPGAQRGLDGVGRGGMASNFSSPAMITEHHEVELNRSVDSLFEAEEHNVKEEDARLGPRWHL